jgi:hypothetical protein
MRRAAWLILSASLLAGCVSARNSAPQVASPVTTAPSVGLSQGQFHDKLKVMCAAPTGWIAQPIDITPQCAQQVWISPTGKTCYGIIHFRMPFPVAHDLLLWFFLNEMRSKEGEVTLVEKRFDDALPGLRYVARGGKYTVHGNLRVSRFDGWVIYAGTLTAEPVVAEELLLAEQARERTTIDEGQ